MLKETLQGQTVCCNSRMYIDSLFVSFIVELMLHNTEINLNNVLFQARIKVAEMSKYTMFKICSLKIMFIYNMVTYNVNIIQLYTFQKRRILLNIKVIDTINKKN